jgi:hypothetical protein
MTHPFSDTYNEARSKFLDLASARGAQVHSFVHPDQKGIEGEDLAMDIAVFGNPAVEKTLLLVSGTHGQEGYTGSAIQIAYLRDLEIPEGVNVVALHALNPWGFSHLSRSDENNVDNNRNFRDFSNLPPLSEINVEVQNMLCPNDWVDETIDWTNTKDRLIAKYGGQAFATAVTGGQTDVPTGLNFCGRAPSWSNRTVQKALPGILAHTRKLVFLEWHTGLGGFGELCHLCLEGPESPAFQRVFKWLGEAASHDMDSLYDDLGGATPAYVGPFSMWLPEAAPNAKCAGLVIEVGTYDINTVAASVRMDRWLKFGEGRSKLTRDEMRRAMMEGLYPTSPEWRAKALLNGCKAQAKLMDGLQRW